MNSIDILIDLAHHPAEAAAGLPTLSPAQLNAHVGGHPNSVAWLLWHSGREIDAQLADLNHQPQQWEKFRSRFGLGEIADGFGLGHTPEEAAQIQVDDQALLVEYLQATLDAFIDYARSLSEADLDEVIDENWTPAVTRGVRMVSMIDDAIQHVGQAAFIAGAR